MGVAAAIAGSFKNRVIDLHTVMIGEVGLTGEVRSVAQLEPRILEAERLGFKRCLVPHSANKGKFLSRTALQVRFVKNLDEVFETVF